jgi:hypothetical protein
MNGLAHCACRAKQSNYEITVIEFNGYGRVHCRYCNIHMRSRCMCINYFAKQLGISYRKLFIRGYYEILKNICDDVLPTPPKAITNPTTTGRSIGWEIDAWLLLTIGTEQRRKDDRARMIEATVGLLNTGMCYSSGRGRCCVKQLLQHMHLEGLERENEYNHLCCLLSGHGRGKKMAKLRRWFGRRKNEKGAVPSCEEHASSGNKAEQKEAISSPLTIESTRKIQPESPPCLLPHSCRNF